MAKITRVERTNRLGRAITVHSGKKKLFKVGVPPEGNVARFVCRQVPAASGGGTAVDFVVDLLERFSVIGMSFDANLESIDALPADIENIRVFPQKSASAGNTVTDYVTGKEGYSYRNGEGTQSVPVRELYLLLSPSNTLTDTLWDVTLVVETEYAT